MVFPLIAAAAMGILVAGQPVQITEAQVEAAEYGHILGAAAQCRGIDQQRVSDAMHHASLAVHALTGSNQEFETARGSFENAAMTGGADVAQGRETCATAEADLKTIEQKFAGK